MTLSELTGKVIRSARRNRVPSPNEIMRSRTFVLASEKLCGDIEIAGFCNGKIIYRRGDDLLVIQIYR